MIPEEIQLTRFKAAVDLLGGPRSAARALEINERTIVRLLAGQSTLHVGFLQDTAAALLEHAEQCKKLERLISPAFASNLTAEQLEKRPHGNTERRGEKRPRPTLSSAPKAPPEYHGGDSEPLDFSQIKAARPSAGRK